MPPHLDMGPEQYSQAPVMDLPLQGYARSISWSALADVPRAKVYYRPGAATADLQCYRAALSLTWDRVQWCRTKASRDWSSQV